MEFFNNAKAVRLKSHLDKFLVADNDQETVRQSRDGASRKARWSVELVEGNPHVVRLKSCFGLYLTASDEPFLLGMTGKKVVQADSYSKRDAATEWEPIKEAYRLKLRTRGGKFLRANGAMPPWRNSVTHDLPNRTATQVWVMWDVDVVDVSVLDDEYLHSSFSDTSSCTDSPYSVRSGSGPVTPVAAEVGLRNSPFAPDRLRPSLLSDRSSHNSGRQDGMEFFNKAKAVRLQSHLGKYLVADDDETTVRQSRNGASRNARWTVEFVEGKRDRIRLKSCHGLYLTAAEEAFLLGMTGKKVLQTLPEKQTDSAIEWQPLKEGQRVKLMTKHGDFLRGNGGAPPWRNSVTHDVPHRTATQSWVLWGVEVVDIKLTDPGYDTGSGGLSVASSFSSVAEDYSGSPDYGSPAIRSGVGSPNLSFKQVAAIEIFRKARSVRLKSRHNKFLTADSDEDHVVQDRSGSSKQAKWTVELVEDSPDVIRLRSCYGRYLKADDEEFLLGVTGRKVSQAMPRKLDSSVEWEPVRDGLLVRLKSRYGNFLRANGGLPPWRNSITHDIPHHHHDWVLWDVDVIEIRRQAPPPQLVKSEPSPEVLDDDLSSPSFYLTSPNHMANASCGDESLRKTEGRMIYYYVADDEGNVNDAVEESSCQFKGHGLLELTQTLEDITGLDGIVVCSRNIVNGQLYPLRLALPPNNVTMHVVVVPHSSKAANEFDPL